MTPLVKGVLISLVAQESLLLAKMAVTRYLGRNKSDDAGVGIGGRERNDRDDLERQLCG